MLRSKEPEGTNTPPDPKLKYLWQFLKSEGGRILVVILIFVGLVLMIPLLYLKGILLGWIAPFSTVFPTADDPESYYLIAEFGAWQAVLVTGFVILMANTFYYVITLFSDLNANDPNRETPRWPFRVVGICLISLIFAFFLFGVHVGLKRSEFATFLEIQSAKLIESQNDGTRSHNKRLTPNSAGTQLRNGITNRFHEIVTNTEYFTLGVFILFVVMDLISYKGKNDQIKVVGIQQRKSLALEKNAISQQLLLIDFPVCLGISLNLLFMSNVDYFRLKSSSIYSFAVGILSMHIIYSQCVFMVVTATMYLRLYRLKNPRKLLVNIAILDNMDEVGSHLKKFIERNIAEYPYDPIEYKVHFKQVTPLTNAGELQQFLMDEKINFLLLDSRPYDLEVSEEGLKPEVVYAKKTLSFNRMYSLICKLKNSDAARAIEAVVVYSHDVNTGESLDPKLLSLTEVKDVFSQIPDSDISVFLTHTEMYSATGTQLYQFNDVKGHPEIKLLGYKKDFRLYGAFVGEVLFHKVREWALSMYEAR